jgi:hypothetical protein
VVAVEQTFSWQLQEEINKHAGAIDDLALLKFAGKHFDQEVGRNFTRHDLLMAALLRIRNKAGRPVRFVPNRAQRQIAARWGDRNIVLKAGN